MTPYWILIALIPPIIWAVINHADKYVIGKYMQQRDPGALIITTGGSAFIMFLVLVVFAPGSGATLTQALWMTLAGFLLAFAYIPYMYALKSDEASNVAPLFQLITPLVFIFAFVFLQETISLAQGISGALIVLGAVLLSIPLHTLRFQKRTFLLMLLSATLIATNVVMFKSIALSATFWDAVRYDLVGITLAGVFLYVFITKYRLALVDAVREHGFPVLGANFLIEVSHIGVRIINGFVTLMVPATLVQFVNGFQPVFILIFGFILTKWIPAIGVEAIDKQSLVRKIIAISLMSVGLILLAVV